MKITRCISRSIASIALLLALMLSIAPPAHAAGNTNTWAHIDTSNAPQGVVSVSIDPVPSGYAVVSLFWKEDGKWTGAKWAIDDDNQAVNIPLMGDGSAYQIKIQQPGTGFELKASFTGTPNSSPWLASCPRVDYNNALEARAMALYLTRGCTTDAQRIHRINFPHLCSRTDGGFFFDGHGVKNELTLSIKKIHKCGQRTAQMKSENL